MIQRWRTILGRLALLVVSLLLALGIGEVGMRALGFRGPTYLRVENTMFVDDPVLNWRHTPNSVFHFNRIEYRINEEGFRDRDYPPAKPAGTVRIFLASDSIGFGVNVQPEDSYPKRLERELNTRFGEGRFEVINCSMPGMSLRQKLHLTQRYAKEYDPDLLLIDYCLNDAAGEMIKRKPPEQRGPCTINVLNLRIPCFLEDRMRESALLFAVKQAIDGVLLRMGVEYENRNYREVAGDFYQDLYGRPETISYLEDNLAAIGDWARANDLAAVMPIFPLLYDFENYKWRPVHALIARLCGENGIAPIDLLDTFTGLDEAELRVQRGDFFHPSADGNRRAANAILEILVDRGLIRTENATRP